MRSLASDCFRDKAPGAAKDGEACSETSLEGRYVDEGEVDLISVIVPVYNTEEYLRACLGSIEQQTYRRLEILLVDDGSTDGSAAICLEFVGRDSRFHYFHTENMGVSSARNVGLESANGALVAFVDSDDWLEPHQYERVASIFRSHEVDAVFFDYFVDSAEVSTRHRETVLAYGILDQAAAIRLELQSQNSFAVTKVFRRELVAKARFNPNLHWGEECLFILQVLQNVHSTFYLPDPLYHYVQSVGSATRRGFNPRRLSGIQTAAEIVVLVESSHPDLVPLARAFEGGILTQLLMEGAHEDAAKVISGKMLKTQLACVFLRTILSRAVPLRQKAQWLIALINIRVLRAIRSRRQWSTRARVSSG